MSQFKETIWCDGCGVEVLWAPVTVQDGTRQHCCDDCLNGLACRCGERMELDERRRAQSEAGPGASLTGDL